MCCGNSALHLAVGSTLPLSLAKRFLKLLLLGLGRSAGRLRKKGFQEFSRGLPLFGLLFLCLSGLITNINQVLLPTQAINGCQELLSTFVFLPMRHIHQPLRHTNQPLGIQLFLRMLVRLQRRKKEVQNRGNRGHLQATLHLVVAMAAHVLLQADQEFAIFANVGMGRQNFTHRRLFVDFTFQELG